MSTPHEQEPFIENTPGLIQDTLELTTYIVAEAFENMYQNPNTTSYAEWVQPDTFTIPGSTLFSILLSESGGKADEGVDMLRIAAFPSREEFVESLSDAIEICHIGKELPFLTSEFIYERTFAEKGVEPILFRVSETEGIIRMPRGSELDQLVAQELPDDFSVLLSGEMSTDSSLATSGATDSMIDRMPPEDGLLLLSMMDIIADNENWPIIPQN